MTNLNTNLLSPENYWKNSGYRLPQDPVVKEFVTPKIKIIQRYINLEGLSILDVGCGNGTFTHYFSSIPGVKVIGTDLSSVMLSKNSCDNVLKSSAYSLPFGNNSVDVAFEANLLHHTDNPKSILLEMKRVAKSYIVLLEPNRVNPVMLLFSLLNKAERGGLKFSKKYIRDLIKLNSLAPIYVESLGLITQNNTPNFAVPFLKCFEKEMFFGAYILSIAKI